MKFEKVNNDKIKITLNSADLKANDIDFHSFMSDSTETQSLFLAVLDKAEKDYGFSTDNYQLKVETLALDNGNFILTITRSHAKNSPDASIEKKKVKVSRKVPSLSSTSLAYKFNSFEDFCDFVKFTDSSKITDIDKMSKRSNLYFYNSSYFLIFQSINIRYPFLKAVCSSITEFGTYIDCSDAFIAKLHESAKLVIKNNVIKVGAKYFN